MIASTSSLAEPSFREHHVLIVGTDGVIGSALKKRLLAKGYQVTGSTRRPDQVGDGRLFLDLQDPKTLVKLESQQFDTAVICGAITSMQACEEKPIQTRQINVDGTITLAKLLSQAGSHIIFLSTNMVFDGHTPHCRATDSKNPLNEYGRQKANVEDWLLSSNTNAAILRFGKVLPPAFPLFQEWLTELSIGKEIRPYGNKSIAPISLPFAIDILAWLIAERRIGIFQATASQDITYGDAALVLARLSGADLSLVKAINSPLPKAASSPASQSSHTTLEFSPEFTPFFSAPSPDLAVSYAASINTF